MHFVSKIPLKHSFVYVIYFMLGPRQRVMGVATLKHSFVYVIYFMLGPR